MLACGKNSAWTTVLSGYAAESHPVILMPIFAFYSL